MLTSATWSRHRREDVLARGRRASVVAGPSPEGASNFPGTCTLELPCAEAGRVLSFVGVGCEGLLPCMLCVGACCSRCNRGFRLLLSAPLGFGFPNGGPAVHTFPCLRLNRPIGLLGQRIGEASHPGPGASTVTKRKRAQARQAQLLAVLEGILKLLSGKGTGGLQSLIEALGPLLADRSPPVHPRPKPKAKPKATPKAKSRPEPAGSPVEAPVPRTTPVVAAPPKRQAQPAPSYALRPGDFHGTVVQYDELSTKLATVPTGPLVLLAADEEQADAAAQLIKGKPLVIPLASGTRVVTQHVIRTEVCCTGVAAPSLKSAPKPAPAPAAATTVIRVVACQGLAPQTLWQRALACFAPR